MPGCTAFGCSNSSEKGFKVHRFPADHKRRLEWAVKVNREKKNGTLLIPSKNSVLCEVHFNEEQYEKARPDKKLKWNAVPTLFAHRTKKQATKRHCRSKSAATENVHQAHLTDHTYSLKTENEGTETPAPATSDIIDDNSEIFPNEKGETIQPTSEAPFDEVLQLRHQLQQANAKIQNLIHQKSRAIKRTHKLKRLNENLTKNLKKMFTDSQIEKLGKWSFRGSKWSKLTITRALKLWFAGGMGGYNELRNQNYPVPSLRTLQRSVSNIQFASGILFDILDKLEIKLRGMSPLQKFCSLTLDEIALTPGYNYDVNTGTFLGDVTLPGHTGKATHALVFMLAGIQDRWKQVVAFYFTSNSTNGAVLYDVISTILQKAKESDLRVISVTSDMGCVNRGMWKAFGISSTKHGRVIYKIPHPAPCENVQSLYFLADVPHLFKNICSAFLQGKDFILPAEIVEKYQLVCNTVSFVYLKNLAHLNENQKLKYSCKLKLSSLQPNHYEKMKVTSATQIFNQEVSAALKYLVIHESWPKEATVTAWFIETVTKWFNLMSSRSLVMALSNSILTTYSEAVAFLNMTVSLFSKLLITGGSSYKPWQAGAVLTTTAVLDLQKQLLDRGFSFVLTGRLTQDCLENLFSCIRIRYPVPTPLQFVRGLKLITVAQFMKLPLHTSYDADESSFLGDLLDTVKHDTCPEDDVEIDSPLLDFANKGKIESSELPILYYLAGFIVSKCRITCTNCLAYVVSNEIPADVPVTTTNLTVLREYKEGSLTFCTSHVLYLIFAAEECIRSLNLFALTNQSNVAKNIAEQVSETTEGSNPTWPKCHAIKNLILTKYINLRMLNYAKELSHKAPGLKATFATKSLGMREIKRNVTS